MALGAAPSSSGICGGDALFLPHNTVAVQIKDFTGFLADQQNSLGIIWGMHY